MALWRSSVRSRSAPPFLIPGSFHCSRPNGKSSAQFSVLWHHSAHALIRAFRKRPKKFWRMKRTVRTHRYKNQMTDFTLRKPRKVQVWKLRLDFQGRVTSRIRAISRTVLLKGFGPRTSKTENHDGKATRKMEKIMAPSSCGMKTDGKGSKAVTTTEKSMENQLPGIPMG